jgi:non-specific serine/threonine protein kinase/serine/threonine-protein kinase
MSALALVYAWQGFSGKGEELNRRTLEIYRRRLGPEAIETLQEMNQLGRVLAAGPFFPERKEDFLRLLEAEKLLKEARDTSRRALGADHPVTLKSAMDLGVAYAIHRRLDEAEPLLREAAMGRRRILGLEHPDTLIAMHNQAINLANLKRYHEAEELWGEVLPVQRRVLGREHPDTLKSMNALGWAYMEDHRYLEAESLFRQALPLSRGALGETHPDTCLLHYNLADVEALQGRRDAAFAAIRGAFAEGGCLWPDIVASDDDLKSLRGDSRFDALIAEMRRLAANAK